MDLRDGSFFGLLITGSYHGEVFAKSAFRRHPMPTLWLVHDDEKGSVHPGSTRIPIPISLELWEVLPSICLMYMYTTERRSVKPARSV